MKIDQECGWCFFCLRFVQCLVLLKREKGYCRFLVNSSIMERKQFHFFVRVYKFEENSHFFWIYQFTYISTKKSRNFVNPPISNMISLIMVAINCQFYNLGSTLIIDLTKQRINSNKAAFLMFRIFRCLTFLIKFLLFGKWQEKWDNNLISQVSQII